MVLNAKITDPKSLCIILPVGFNLQWNDYIGKSCLWLTLYKHAVQSLDLNLRALYKLGVLPGR